MKALAAQVRGGVRVGATGRPIRAVVNLGIGGSDLGPLLVCSALAQPPRARDAAGPQTEGVDVAFVSNVDPEHLTRALAPLDPATTLFVVTSKTFTTQETLANATRREGVARRARSARASTSARISSASPATRRRRAAFGIARADILPLPDWVGGRYSLWSRGRDSRSRSSSDTTASPSSWRARPPSMRTSGRRPSSAIFPSCSGLAGWWNAAQLRHPDRVVVPYAQALARLPAYLQQVVLESNGKRVARDGGPLAGPSAPALWGDTGTNGQHAFFQWLHQGTREAPVEFIVPVRAAHPLADQQTLLVANALAQAQALLAGRRRRMRCAPSFSPRV